MSFKPDVFDPAMLFEIVVVGESNTWTWKTIIYYLTVSKKRIFRDYTMQGILGHRSLDDGLFGRFCAVMACTIWQVTIVMNWSQVLSDDSILSAHVQNVGHVQIPKAIEQETQ